jgi:phosphatidylglycerophosphate synthase
MNSFFKNFLKQKGEIIIPYLHKFNLKPNDITTLGIILNGLALINLLHKEFVVFILLFFTAYYCDILDGLYARKYNMETKIGAKYDHIADWIKLYTTFVIFRCMNKRKININHYIFLVIILILCNIHYVLKYLKDDDLQEKSSNVINNYVDFTKKLKIEKLEKYSYITKYFDESMIILYSIILMIYIYYH